MGNRAVITNKDRQIGVYLHWNGGRDSVNSFLTYCKIAGYRDLTSDPTYGFARLTQVISNWFGGNLSVGVNVLSKLDCDNFDNGMYIVDGWDIVGREYHEGEEQDEYDLEEMLLDIDSKQPCHLGEEEIKKYLKEHPQNAESETHEPDPAFEAIQALGHKIEKTNNGYLIEIIDCPNGGSYQFEIEDKHNVVHELYEEMDNFDEDSYVSNNMDSLSIVPKFRKLLEDAESIKDSLTEMEKEVRVAVEKYNKK